jgi:peptidoglycan/LPS O-acetylase OafA/YrhL
MHARVQVLSGFVTHWSCAPKAIGTRGGAMQLYVRRFGRVAFSAWLSMAYMLALSWAAGVPSQAPLSYHVSCFCLVQPWSLPFAMSADSVFCPNGVVWTVSGLLPSWLLYPFVHHRMLKAMTARSLLPLLVATWALLEGAVLYTYLANDLYVDPKTTMLFYMWPPASLPGFACGAIAAEAAHRHVRRHHRSQHPSAGGRANGGAADDERRPLALSAPDTLEAHGLHEAARNGENSLLTPDNVAASPTAWQDGARAGRIRTGRALLARHLRGTIADVALALPVLVALVLPAYHEDASGRVADGLVDRRDGYEPLLTHGFALCFAAFLYASSTADVASGERTGLAERALSHAALVSLGDFSFVVYLFQAPVFRSLELAYGDERFVALQHTEPKLAVLALCILYATSALYASLVEVRVVAWLRAISSGWAPTSDDAPPAAGTGSAGAAAQGPTAEPAGGINGPRSSHAIQGRASGLASGRVAGYGTTGADGVAMQVSRSWGYGGPQRAGGLQLHFEEPAR